ncbi:MAG: GNAT family N-acetyltransferase [Anaerolineae bacterium]
MPEMRLTAADSLPLTALTALLNAVYADYALPVQRSSQQVAIHHAVWDIEPALSVIAWMENEPVGVALLGRRGQAGWIGSMGVLPAWRRQGIGLHMLHQVQANARRAGLSHVDLEVLTRNTQAQALYEVAGFQVQRELLTWQRRVEQGALPDPYFKLQPTSVAWALQQASAWHTTPPCWQRSVGSLLHMTDLRAFTVTDQSGETPVYLLMRHLMQGQIRLADIGIAPGHEPRGLGRELLQGFHLRHFDANVILGNEPVESPWNRVFVALGYYVIERQHEMRWLVT